MRIVPIHFEREIFAKSKHNLESYSRLGYLRLKDIIRELETKHTDKLFKSELSKLRDIVKESVSESFSK